jgi:hypothetical protein
MLLGKFAAQQSVHPTLGSLRKSQAFFYALAFFQLDGFAVPAPARVTQTVGRQAVIVQISYLGEVSWIRKQRIGKLENF